MSLPEAEHANANAWVACLNELIPADSSLAKAIAWMIGEEGMVNQCIKDLILGLDSDEQQLTLTGNTLILEDGGTVDLTPFLDNSDDQNVTAFSLVDTVVTLTIEDGNTVTVDLASIDTDDQTLELAGTLLSISEGNSVDLAALNTDMQVLSTEVDAAGVTSSVTISNGNTVRILHPAAQTAVTCSEIRALNNSGTAIQGHPYLVTDYNKGTLGAVTILVHGAADGTVGHSAEVATAFDVGAWSGRFDSATCRIYDLRDNLGNYVRGDVGNEVEAFPWGNSDVTGNDFHGVRLVYTSGVMVDNVGSPGAFLTVDDATIRQSAFGGQTVANFSASSSFLNSDVRSGARVTQAGGSILRLSLGAYGFVEVDGITVSSVNVESLGILYSNGGAGTVARTHISSGSVLNVRNVPDVDIDRLSLFSYGRVSAPGAAKVHLQDAIATSSGYFQAAAGTSLTVERSQAQANGYIRSRRGELIAVGVTVNRGVVDQNSSGVNTAFDVTVDSSGIVLFNETVSDALIEDSRIGQAGQVQFRGTGGAGNEVVGVNVVGGQIRIRNSTDAVVEYAEVQSSASYIELRSVTDSRISRSQVTSSGIIDMFDGVDGGAIENTVVSSEGRIRYRGGSGGAIEGATFTSGFEYSVEGLTAAKVGLSGTGPTLYTDPDPTTATTGLPERNF